MSDEREKPAEAAEKQAPPPDERSIDLSERQRGIDVRPTSDPSAVNLPSMGGLAPIEAAPTDSRGGAEAQPSGEHDPADGSDGEE